MCEADGWPRQRARRTEMMATVLIKGVLRIAAYYMLCLIVYLVFFRAPGRGLDYVPDDPAMAAACDRLRAGMTVPEAENQFGQVLRIRSVNPARIVRTETHVEVSRGMTICNITLDNTTARVVSFRTVNKSGLALVE